MSTGVAARAAAAELAGIASDDKTTTRTAVLITPTYDTS
jgi:hypothetical protein